MDKITAKIETEKYVYVESELDEYVGLITILQSETPVWDCINDLDFSERYHHQKILIDLALKPTINPTPLRFAEYVVGDPSHPLEYTFPTEKCIHFANTVLKEHEKEVMNAPISGLNKRKILSDEVGGNG